MLQMSSKSPKTMSMDFPKAHGHSGRGSLEDLFHLVVVIRIDHESVAIAQHPPDVSPPPLR